MSIHDEFERAVGGKSKGMGPLAKVFIGLALFGVFAFAAVAVVAVVVANRVQDEFQDLRRDPQVVVAEKLIRHSQDLELVSSNREARTITFRTRSDGQVRTADVDEILEGGLRISTDEGELRINLTGGEDGGALVIQKPDGEVVRIDATGQDGQARVSVTTGDGEVLRIDARGHDDHGALVIRSQGSTLRFDAEGADDRGSLSIRTEEGELVRFDVQGQDEDARLTITTPEGETTLTGMREGGEAPGWLPRAPSRVRERTVYTAESETGEAGAVRFELRDDLASVLGYYADVLEDDGFTVRSQDLDVNRRTVQGTLVAEREGRSVVVVAAGGEETTHVFLAWSER